jgi:hypothetical protein
MIVGVVVGLFFSGCGSGPLPAAPEKAKEYFSDIKVKDSDTFEKDSGKWQVLAPGGIGDGALTLTGKDWFSDAYKEPVADGRGIIVDFTYSPGAVFEILFTSGDWGTDQHKRFGVYVDSNNIRPNNPPLNAGRENLAGVYPLKPNTAYTAMMAIVPGGQFLAVFWDPANPQTAIEYQKVVGDGWAGFQWTFSVGCNYGAVRFDNFQLVEIGALKKTIQ